MKIYDLLPPIPEQWLDLKPYVIVGEKEEPEPVQEKKPNCYRDTYQEDYRIKNRDKLNQKRRDWYEKVGRAKYEEKKELKRLELLAKIERGFQGES